NGLDCADIDYAPDDTAVRSELFLIIPVPRCRCREVQVRQDIGNRVPDKSASGKIKTESGTAEREVGPVEAIEIYGVSRRGANETDILQAGGLRETWIGPSEGAPERVITRSK